MFGISTAQFCQNVNGTYRLNANLAEQAEALATQFANARRKLLVTRFKRKERSSSAGLYYSN